MKIVCIYFFESVLVTSWIAHGIGTLLNQVHLLFSFQDMQWLLDNLPNVKDKLYIDKVPFSHQSFVMGKNSHLIIGPYIVKQLSKNN